MDFDVNAPSMAEVGIGDIVSAVAAAKAEIKTLGKGERNRHDGYNYASIDNFLSLVNPICAKHGLVTWMDEEGIEDITKVGRKGETQWMRLRFLITVYHKSGSSLPPVRRSVEVLRNGAQAFGSAQSYVLKQFLRALLEIPTGDGDDADQRATDDGEWSRNQAPQHPHDQPAFDPAPQRDRIKGRIQVVASLDDLKATWGEEWTVIKALPEPMRLELTKVKDDRKANLSLEDEIPY